jgi:photosystem II stability/assembly factor-like uncharacterized protein
MLLKKLFLLLAVILTNPASPNLFPAAAPSQAVNWVPLASPQAPGGNVIALALSPSSPDVLYNLIEGAQGGRFFRSLDTGATWQERHVFLSANQNEIRNLAVDTANPETVYANGAAGLQRSLNGGDTWETIYSLGDVFAAVSSNRLYAGGPADACGINEHIFHLARSDNGGQTWQSVSLGCLFKLEQIAVLPSQPDVVYLSTLKSRVYTSTLLKSTDGGQTWNTFTLPYEGASAALIIDPADPQRLFSSGYGISRSFDGGETWEQVSAKGMGNFLPLALSSGRLYAIEATMYRSPMYRSDDGGTTWWVTLNELPAGAVALQADPAHPGRLWAGLVNYGIYLSEDGGGSWSQRNAGIQTHAWINALAISPSNVDVMYAAADVPYPGVYRTIDGGQTWSLPLKGFIDILEYPAGIFRPISPHKSETGFPYPLLEIHKLLVHPLHPEFAWAATSNGIYETTNGLDWQLGLSIGSAFDLAVSKAAPDQPYAALLDSSYNQPYIAQRLCKEPHFTCNWYINPINTGQLSIDVIKVDPVDPARLLSDGAVNTSVSKAIAIFQSLDSGTTWQRIGLIDVYAALGDLAIAPRNNQVMAASLENFQSQKNWVFRSLNGGVTWEDWSTGLPAWFGWDEKLPLVMDELGSSYLGTSDGVYRRLPSQSAWVQYGLQGYSIRALFYRPGPAPMLLAAGKDGLWRLDLPPIRWTWLPLVRVAAP